VEAAAAAVETTCSGSGGGSGGRKFDATASISPQGLQ